MDDVFVSYRWEDGHAASSLAEALNSSLTTFIDLKRIGPGQELENTIIPAVRGARVVVAVIGKAWVRRGSLKKLHAADDWVGRELTEAFARPGILVIPVVVDEGIRMPSPAELPLALQPLLGRARRTLRRERWKTDVEDFINEIRDTLESMPRAAASTFMPADIPFLCDRIPQDDGFAELAAGAARSKAIFCIVHGHMFEAHMGYMRRLRARRTLERMFGVTHLGIGLHTLQWNRDYAQQGLYDKLLRSALKRDAMKIEQASDEALMRFLESAGRPTVLVMQVAWSDLKQAGKSLLGSLEAAWNRLLGELQVIPAQVLVLCINLTYYDATQEVEAGAPNLLVKLQPVKLSDVLTWMELAEVQPHIASRRSALLTMASAIGEGELHMQEFVDAVHALIPAQQEHF